jgi:predicted metal-binding membrane protein
MAAITTAFAERILRHERALLVAAVSLVIALSWAYLLLGAGTMEEMDGMLMPMSAGPWTLAHALLMLCMWVVMMVAMMLPSAMPMMLFYSTIARRQSTTSGFTSRVSLFAVGYLAVWSLFSVGAVVLQFLLERAALLSSMMESTSIVLAGAILIMAGLYQWTPLKSSCLTQCQSPLDFVMANWRSGRAGAFQMGFRHGIYCVGCCWVLMLLLFVGGVMNLAWIAGLAVYVLVEKALPGHWISRATGVVFIVWGLATLTSITPPA